MATKSKKTAAKVDYTNETEAQIEKRLGPSKKIVRWIPKNKKRRIAVLECGHRRSRTMEKQQTIRCNACRVEKLKGTKKVAAKKIAPKKSEQKAA